ncbi:MAG TPA: tetratricopeptide repeat protein [Terriglobales bacterium]|jgi:predicted Zn-dependent protease|nr:tetratricopeptide repeat protein [Terriglobales bacterium]
MKYPLLLRPGVLLIAVMLAGVANALSGSSERETIASAGALVHTGKIQQAEALLQQASQASPQSVLLHEALGELFFQEKKFEDSVLELTLAVQIDPSSRQYNMLLASALIGWTHFDVAVDFLHAAESRFGQFPEFHYYLGIAQFNMNKVDLAKVEFERTLHLAPDFDRAQFLLAKCLMSQGKQDEALPLYRNLVKQHEENPIYWVSLAEALETSGADETAALRAGRRAVALAPNNAFSLFTLATILIRAEAFSSALPLLEKASRIDPIAIPPHLALARTYARLNKPLLAQKQTKIVDQLQRQTGSGNAPTGLVQ